MRQRKMGENNRSPRSGVSVMIVANCNRYCAIGADSDEGYNYDSASSSCYGESIKNLVLLTRPTEATSE